MTKYDTFIANVLQDNNKREQPSNTCPNTNVDACETPTIFDKKPIQDTDAKTVKQNLWQWIKETILK